MLESEINRLVAGVAIAGIAMGICHAQETASEYGRERYDVIVERSPFGADPLTDAELADKEAATTLKTLEKELRLCFLLKSQSGEVRAGFQNIKAKPGEPKSVMLMEGESFRAMKLLEIDLENSSATLQYQGKPLIFELSKAPAATAAAIAAAAKKPQAPTQPQPQRRFGSGFRRNSQPAEPAEPAPEPKPPEPVLSPEEQVQRQEEVRENLRQYQMEVIRAGMPPLPIPLTKEMDDQLVAEGVLPPAEAD